MSTGPGELTRAIARVGRAARVDDAQDATTTITPPGASTPAYARRRGIELFGVLVAAALGIGGYLAVGQTRLGHLPDHWAPVSAAWVVLGVAAHLVVRWRVPYADPVLLPAIWLLNGLGLAMLYRLDQYWATNGARTQFTWTVVALVAFAAVMIVLHDYRVLQRYPYVLFLIGLAFLLLPLIPHLGIELNGSRIWIRIAGYSFQPAEVAKIVLALAFASYLADRRDMLQHAGRKLGRLTLPRLRDLVPVLIMWGASLVVLVFQNDLGTSLLFFGLFVMMLYLATDQPGVVILGVVLFAVAAVLVYTQTSHVQTRVEAWLHPFADRDRNAQVIQAQYGLAWGGLLGRGWGNGAPGRIPLANSDFIAAAVGEELGVAGLAAIVLVYAIIVERALRAALVARDSFGKLLAAGLGFIIALQVFAIVGGVTRLLPLTGLTTPFMSQGGSSLLANWIIAAVLLIISHQARRPVLEPAAIADPEAPAIPEADLLAARAADLLPTQVVARAEPSPDDVPTQVTPAPPDPDDVPTQLVERPKPEEVSP